jgi:hypothetical protein
LVKQHWVWRRGIGNTQRQAWELISGPCLGANARFLHLYLIGLSDNPLCRRCGAEEETSAHTLCECEALASLSHVYLCSFVLDPDDIKSIKLGTIWIFSKVTGLP